MEFVVTPVILPCEGDLAVMRQFAQSFANVRHALEPPVVLIDQNKSPRMSASLILRAPDGAAAGDAAATG
jgi:hypothetical protein